MYPFEPPFVVSFPLLSFAFLYESELPYNDEYLLLPIASLLLFLEILGSKRLHLPSSFFFFFSKNIQYLRI